MNDSLRILFSIVTVISGLGTISPNLEAEELRHHEAHEHGVAHLNVAHDGKNLYIKLTSPAANIVGFEYRPCTPEQKAAVTETKQTALELTAKKKKIIFSRVKF